MMKLSLLIAALATCAPADAAAPARSPAVQQAYDAGFHDCAGAFDQLVKFVHEDDVYGYYDQWSTKAPNDSLASTLTIKQYSDGRAISSISAVKNSTGKCDAILFSTIPFLDKTCASMRENLFKDWKLIKDFDGTSLYEDPTMPNSTVALTPLGPAACLIVKKLVGLGLNP